jgi:hypothetical protein
VDSVLSGDVRLVFSPEAVLRFHDGRMLIHTASSAPPFVTDQPALIDRCGADFASGRVA